MHKQIHDPDEMCDSCYVIGMTFKCITIVKVIFNGSTSEMPIHYHLCENCGNEFRSPNERSLNLRVRLVMLKYFQKFRE